MHETTIIKLPASVKIFDEQTPKDTAYMLKEQFAIRARSR
jgi:hypothetical protein